MDMTIAASADNVSVFRQRLLVWYDDHARVLPWRVGPESQEKSDAYRVWLSEVMLQQTTVPHAAPYFEKFTKLWPTVRDLAAADDAQVMAEWAGLGYYSRARNLLKCARIVVSDYEGAFPEDESKLLKLPGFGPYTAAAVMAFAFGEAANVVDGNVERIMSRFYAVKTAVPEARPELRRLAALWVRPERARDWPQALMDLASLICRPKSPLCEKCPLNSGCQAFAEGRAETYPVKAVKVPKPVRHGVVFVFYSAEGVVVERRPDKGLLGGMLGLPHLEWRAEPWGRIDEIEGISAKNGEIYAGNYTHVFTHFTLRQEVWGRCLSETEMAEYLRQHNNYQLLTWGDKKALPTVFGKALKFIDGA
ncbi:MAG: A/G-specific adenine glycosylase [Asticcacaulis sp.]